MECTLWHSGYGLYKFYLARFLQYPIVSAAHLRISSSVSIFVLIPSSGVVVSVLLSVQPPATLCPAVPERKQRLNGAAI